MHSILPDNKQRGTRGHAIGTLLALTLAACAEVPPTTVPAVLAPGASETLFTTVAARGVQIYECRAAGSAGQAAWAFVAPEAELLDATNRPAGHHGAGPYWQARDGSRVIGTVKARAEAPLAGAIPWLLLSTSASGSKGVFSRVTSVQRVNTTGGVAPAAGCDAQSLGSTARVPYSADYHLFARR